MIQPNAPSRLKLGDAYAELVIGSLQAGQPRYMLNGDLVDVDVRIPDDLAQDWYWVGAFLCYRAPGRVDLSICADTFGVQEAFALARRFMAQDQRYATPEAAGVQLEVF